MDRVTSLRIIICLILAIDNMHSLELKFENNLLRDLFRMYDKPSSAVAGIDCWSMQDKTRLVKSFIASMAVLESNASFLPLFLPEHEIVFIVDAQCDGYKNLLFSAEQQRFFKAPYRWIIMAGKENGDIDDFENSNVIADLLEGINILAESDVLIALRISHYKYNVKQVYRRYINGALIEDVYALWSYQNGIENDVNPTKSLAIRRTNLMGTLIRVSYVITDNDTKNHLQDYRNQEIDTITKVNYILTSHLIDWLNATRSFTFVSSWGYRDSEDGSWSGMIGELTRDEADVGGTPLFFTADRITVIDYIAMPTPTRSKFVFRQPKLSYVSNVFVLPFKTTVWISSICLVIILAIIIYVGSYWEWTPCRKDETHETDPGLLRASWSDVITLTLGAICQQGSNVELKGPMGRLTMLLLFLSVMFLYTSYSANIVALLQSSSSRIHTLSDLLNSRLTFGVHDTVFNHYYFSTASEPVRQSIYQKKVAPPGEAPHFMTLEEGVRKLQQGLFAFHMEIGVGYKVVGEVFQEDEKCGLQEIQYLQVIDPWLAVQKNTSFKEMFKIGMRRIQEFGLQNRENWRLYTKKPHCTGHGTKFVSVGIVDCYPAMAILAYGLVAAFFILCVELAYLKISRRKKMDSTIQDETTAANQSTIREELPYLE